MKFNKNISFWFNKKNVISFNEYQSEVKKVFNNIQIEFNDNNLKYFLHSGSLLGAIRHNDIIPWDDDMDIGMDMLDFYSNRKLIKKVTKKNDLMDYSKIWFSPFWRRDLQYPLETKKWYFTEYEGNIYRSKIKIDIMLGVQKQYYFDYINKNKDSLITIPNLKEMHHWALAKRKIQKKEFLDFMKEYSNFKKNEDELILVYMFTFRNDLFNLNIQDHKFGEYNFKIPSNYEDVLISSFGHNWKDEYKTNPHMVKRTNLKLYKEFSGQKIYKHSKKNIYYELKNGKIKRLWFSKNKIK